MPITYDQHNWLVFWHSLRTKIRRSGCEIGRSSHLETAARDRPRRRPATRAPFCEGHRRRGADPGPTLTRRPPPPRGRGGDGPRRVLRGNTSANAGGVPRWRKPQERAVFVVLQGVTQLPPLPRRRSNGNLSFHLGQTKGNWSYPLRTGDRRAPVSQVKSQNPLGPGRHCSPQRPQRAQRGRRLAGEVARSAWWLRAPFPKTISP